MILLLLADGFHENELTEQIPALRASGCDIQTASLSDLSVASASGRVFDCAYTLDNLPAEEISLLILSDTAQNLPAALLIAQGVRMNGGRISFFHTKYRFDEEVTDRTADIDTSEEIVAAEEELSDSANDDEVEEIFTKADENEALESVSEYNAAKENNPEIHPEDAASDADSDESSEKSDETENSEYHHISPTLFPARPLPDYRMLSRNSHIKFLPSVYERQVGESLVAFLENFGIRSDLASVKHSARYTVYTVAPRRGTPNDTLTDTLFQTEKILADEGIHLTRSKSNPFLLNFEMENTDASPLTVGDMMDRKKAENLPDSVLPLGETPTGEAVFISPERLGNLLITGEDTKETSNLLLALLSSILVSQKPNDAAFLIADMETNRFLPMNGLPHLLMPTLSSEESALGALLWLKEECELRINLIEESECQTAEECRAFLQTNGTDFPLPEIYVVLCGMDNLVQYRNTIFALLTECMPLFAKADIHIFFSLPKIINSGIPTAILDTCSMRISFRVPTAEDSLAVLYEKGAEALSNPGEALFFDGTRLLRLECPHVSESDFEKLIAALHSLYPMEKQNPAIAESAAVLLDAYLNPTEEIPDEDTEESEEKANETAAEEEKENEETAPAENEPQSEPSLPDQEKNAVDPEEQDASPDVPKDDNALSLKSLLENQSFLAAARAALKLGKISANRLMLLFDFNSEKAKEILNMLEVLGLVNKADVRGECITRMTEAEWTNLLKQIANS